MPRASIVFCFCYLEHCCADFRKQNRKSNSIKDTCSVITVTLDISKRKYPVVFTRETLPQTCLKLIPVPDSMSVIIIAADAIIYIDDSSLGIGIAVNTYASS